MLTQLIYILNVELYNKHIGEKQLSDLTFDTYSF